MAKINTFALIGAGGSGKSFLAKELSSRVAVESVDIDDLFFSSYGSVSSFAAAYGWREYFETQGRLTRAYLRSIASIETKLLIVLPASSLCHEDYPDVCEETLAVAKDTCRFICVLASSDPCIGAEISVQRQSLRGYPISVARKTRQYIYQSQFYQKISEYYFVNGGDLTISIKKLSEIIIGI